MNLAVRSQVIGPEVAATIKENVDLGRIYTQPRKKAGNVRLPKFGLAVVNKDLRRRTMTKSLWKQAQFKINVSEIKIEN